MSNMKNIIGIAALSEATFDLRCARTTELPTDGGDPSKCQNSNEQWQLFRVKFLPNSRNIARTASLVKEKSIYVDV